MGQYHKLSVEDFVKRASLIHQYIYDYSNITSFKNAHEKVPIYCHKHGLFHQTVSNHLYNNYGCPTCAAIQRGLDGMISQEEVLERFRAKHGDKYCYSEVVYSGFIDDLETEILSKFPTGIVTKEDMNSGYTETISCEYLPQIIDIIVYKFNENMPA